MPKKADTYPPVDEKTIGRKLREVQTPTRNHPGRGGQEARHLTVALLRVRARRAAASRRPRRRTRQDPRQLRRRAALPQALQGQWDAQGSRASFSDSQKIDTLSKQRQEDSAQHHRHLRRQSVLTPARRPSVPRKDRSFPGRPAHSPEGPLVPIPGIEAVAAVRGRCSQLRKDRATSGVVLQGGASPVLVRLLRRGLRPCGCRAPVDAGATRLRGRWSRQPAARARTLAAHRSPLAWTLSAPRPRAQAVAHRTRRSAGRTAPRSPRPGQRRVQARPRGLHGSAPQLVPGLTPQTASGRLRRGPATDDQRLDGARNAHGRLRDKTAAAMRPLNDDRALARSPAPKVRPAGRVTGRAPLEDQARRRAPARARSRSWGACARSDGARSGAAEAVVPAAAPEGHRRHKARGRAGDEQRIFRMRGAC